MFQKEGVVFVHRYLVHNLTVSDELLHVLRRHAAGEIQLRFAWPFERYASKSLAS